LRERLSTDNLPECRSCSWRSLCGGGCAVPRLRIGPGSDAPVAVLEYARRVNCAFTSAAYELLLWDQATRTHASLAGKTGDASMERV
jgi:sulfatase maturation enzyme AslB (radical SAM superfamily)